MIEIDLVKLESGARTERVKVTRGGTTFYRKQRVGRKEKPEESREARATKMIADHEQTIKDQKFESCAAFDEYGSLIFTKDGEKDNVKFTPEEKNKFKGTRFTHNHPIGHSFSTADINFACIAEMKEMRVISSKGKTYSLKMKDGSNFNRDMWYKNIGPVFAENERSVREYFTGKIETGLMTIEDANNAHYDTIWKRVAIDLENLIIYKGD